MFVITYLLGGSYYYSGQSVSSLEEEELACFSKVMLTQPSLIIIPLFPPLHTHSLQKKSEFIYM